MSQSIRFLGYAIFAWVGVRAVSLGMVPGAEALAFDAQPRATVPTTSLPPLPPTRFDPVEPVAPAGRFVPPNPAGAVSPEMAYGYGPSYGPYAAYAGYPPYPPPRSAYPAPVPYPVYVPVPSAGPSQSRAPSRRVRYEDDLPALGWNSDSDGRSNGAEQLALAAPVRPAIQVTPSFQGEPPPKGLDRWQLSSWAMLRSRPGPSGLASNGMLGGSQAGARLLYRFDPRLALSVRTTSALQSTQRGMEVAAGIRAQPFRSIPVAVTLERRQWVGKGIGRSDFALFAEGGLWGQSIPFGMTLDGYLQAGIVGHKERDWFVDGSLAATRPMWRNMSAGFGVWGGAQQGLKRLDAGPRVTLNMGKGMRIHADYRAKLLGNAEPGSGAVVTLAGDF